MLFYLYHDVATDWPSGLSVLEISQVTPRQATWKTSPGGEFGWGGTSVE